MRRNPVLALVAVLAMGAASFAVAPAQTRKIAKKAAKTRDVTIYVYKRPPETSGEFYGTIVPVQRRIVDRRPLSAALRLLLKGADEKEEARELEDFIFGLRFVSARIRNKTAEINFKFTHPEIAIESWEGGGFDHDNFVRAVELTAKQFPGVERVSICVDGRRDYFGYRGGAKCSFPMFPQKIKR